MHATAMPSPRGTTAADIRHPHYQEIKGRVHQELLNRLNLERLTRSLARGGRAGDPER